MNTILSDLAESQSAKVAIKPHWGNYHYYLAQARNAELSIGRYLNWLMTDLPDHFMNLLVSTQVPYQAAAELMSRSLIHFHSVKIRKLSCALR